MKFDFLDLGTNNSKKSVNYPDYAHKLCKKVSNNSNNMGILVCGSGMGMSMAANRHKKIRAAVCYSIKNTKLSRLHNNANIITLGSRLTKKNTAFKCIEVFINTKIDKCTNEIEYKINEIIKLNQNKLYIKNFIYNFKFK